MTAPERIWAWVWNYPISKHHGSKVWVDFKPFWKKPITTFVSTSKWNPFVGRMEVCEQEVTEYVHIDLHDATKAQLAKAVAALRAVEDEYSDIGWGPELSSIKQARAALAEIEKGGV